MVNGLLDVLAVLLPSVGVGVLFFFAMRALLNADRFERKAFAEEEKRYRQTHHDENL